MTNCRIPFDSSQWDSSSSMQKARRMLQSLLQTDEISSNAVENFIYEFEGCDSYEPAYYFSLPYLTDYFLKHRTDLLNVISDFCNPLMIANSIPLECREQIQSASSEIIELMLFALEKNSEKNGIEYNESCRTYVAGIAAVYMESYVARQIAIPD